MKRESKALPILLACLLLLGFNGHYLVGSLTKDYYASFVYLFVVWFMVTLILFLQSHFSGEDAV